MGKKIYYKPISRGNSTIYVPRTIPKPPKTLFEKLKEAIKRNYSK